MAQELSFEEAKRGISIIHASLLIGVILINVILYFFVGPINFNPDFDLGPASMGVLVFSAAAIFMSHSIFSKRIAAIGTATLTKENAKELTAAHILKWAILEAVILVNTLYMYFILESNGPAFSHLLMIIFAMAIMFLSKPKIY